MQAGVYVDRSNSGPYSNSTMQGGVMPLPPSGLQASSVTLRVFVDHSIVEVSCTAPCRMSAPHRWIYSSTACPGEHLINYLPGAKWQSQLPSCGFGDPLHMRKGESVK